MMASDITSQDSVAPSTPYDEVKSSPFSGQGIIIIYSREYTSYSRRRRRRGSRRRRRRRRRRKRKRRRKKRRRRKKKKKKKKKKNKKKKEEVMVHFVGGRKSIYKNTTNTTGIGTLDCIVLSKFETLSKLYIVCLVTKDPVHLGV